MSFSVKKLFSNLFLSVVLEGNECIFFGQVFRNGKLLKTINAKFTDINIDNIDEKIIKYIEEQEKAYFGVCYWSAGSGENIFRITVCL